MKKILYIFSIIGLVIVLDSCEDNLFQEPMTSKVSSNMFNDEAGIEEAVKGTYAGLQQTGLYNYTIIAMGEVSSDNTFDEVMVNDNGMFGQMDEFTIIPANEAVSINWKDSYICIQRANLVLNRIDDIPFKDSEVKSARKGEMKFIRALIYFNLVRIYGDVPLVTQETVDPNDYFGQGRTDMNEVYAQIEKDLKEAINELPSTVREPGRVSKGAAEALLGKVYLTRKNYTEARTYLLNVVNSDYALLENPADVFDINNEWNKEIIFSVQFASGINGNTEGSRLFQMFSPTGTISGAKGHNLPTRSMYNLYDTTDKRRNAYLGITDAEVPYSKKYAEPTTEPYDGGSDVIVLRYADVLLMIAEVENELGNTDEALNYLNMIRDRAGLANSTAVTQDEVREAIALERRFELINEGHRWFDLLRTGKAIEVMNRWFADEGMNIVIDEHDLLMPIPQNQVDTDPAIKQNPGF